MSVAPPVHVDAVVKDYPGGIRALDGASFTVEPGARACLLGPNGAGKTTLIRLLTGALRPSRGVVRVFGLSADHPDFLAAKRRVGVVPQSPGMYRDLTAREYLALVAKLYGRGNPFEAVEHFGLAAVADRPMAQLSGGYQRRLALAAALLPAPELLLLDEPTAGLDPIAAREVRGYLRDAMRGRAALLCTHDLAEAEALCDDAVIVQAGRVLVHESIVKLRARSAPRLLLAASQGAGPLAAALSALGRDGAVAVLGAERVQLEIAHARAAAPEILRGLLGRGLDVYECRVLDPTLEELFVDMVGARGGGRAAE